MQTLHARRKMRLWKEDFATEGRIAGKEGSEKGYKNVFRNDRTPVKPEQYDDISPMIHCEGQKERSGK